MTRALITKNYTKVIRSAVGGLTIVQLGVISDRARTCNPSSSASAPWPASVVCELSCRLGASSGCCVSGKQENTDLLQNPCSHEVSILRSFSFSGLHCL